LAIGYFLPGLRHLNAFIAGASRLRFWIFALFAYTGGLLWVATFVTLGYFVGEEWARTIPQVRTYLWEVTAGLAALAAAVYLGLKIKHLGQRG
jgi:membrane protein DedA with SNARE-associated domain